MNLITIIVIAIGLAMDSFAVSIVSGSTNKQLKVRQALLMAIFFGGFQLFMPLVGSLAGLGLKEYIAGYDHWVAFGLLAAVGGKMIYESFRVKSASKNLNLSNIFVLLVLSVATSIDALAVGVTISLITATVARAVIIIGLVTFMMSYLGVFIGKKFGHFFESRVEAVGGAVLIGIGLKILFEHLWRKPS
jgi:putative Mn2+ efflux pump MntP